MAGTLTRTTTAAAFVRGTAADRAPEVIPGGDRIVRDVGEHARWNALDPRAKAKLLRLEHQALELRDRFEAARSRREDARSALARARTDVAIWRGPATGDVAPQHLHDAVAFHEQELAGHQRAYETLGPAASAARALVEQSWRFLGLEWRREAVML